MTYSRLLSLFLLLTSFAFLSACQEEEDADVLRSSTKEIYNPKATYLEQPEIVAETVLISDQRTTEILGQQGQLFFRLPRPVGCPRRLGPLCEPTLEFLLAGLKGLELERFSPKEGFEGSIYDPETGIVVAKLTEVGSLKEFRLVFTVVESQKISSDVLTVNFSTMYNTGKTTQFVSFEGELTADIFEFF